MTALGFAGTRPPVPRLDLRAPPARATSPRAPRWTMVSVGQPADVVSGARALAARKNLQVAAKQGDTKACRDIFSTMPPEDKFHIVSFSILLHGYRNARDPRGCVSVLQEMERRSIPCNRVISRDAVWACIENQDCTSAQDVLHIVEDMNGNSDIKSWNAVLKLLLSRKMYNPAIRIFRRLRLSKRVQPDTITYNILIFQFGQSGQDEEMQRAIRYFGAALANTKLGPDVVTYNSLLGCCLRSDKPNLAPVILSSMSSRDVRPSIRTATLALRLGARQYERQTTHSVADGKKMMQLYKSVLVNSGATPDLLYFNAALEALSRIGCVEGCQQILADIEVSLVEPDLMSYNCALACSGRARDTETCRQLLDTMRQNGVAPDSYSYCSAIASCRSSGTAKVALDLYEEAHEQGVKITSPLINALILAASGNVKEALAIWKLVRRHGGIPGVAGYEGLLRVCGAAGRPDVALQCIYAMRKDGLSTSPRLVTVLLNGARDSDVLEIDSGWRKPFMRVIRAECQAIDKSEASIERLVIRW